MKYRALILDIDGTLTPTGRAALPTVKVAEAVAKAQKVLHVGVATGRSLNQALEMIPNIHLSGPSVFASGSQVIDPSTGKIFEEHKLMRGQYLEALKISQTFNKNLGAYVDGEKVAASEAMGDPASIFITDLSPEEYEKIKIAFAKIPGVEIHKTTSWTSGCNDLHISNEKARKDLALIRVAEILKIKPEEMIGVGDGPNDISFIKVCGLKVALGDAVPELKAIADYVAPTFKEDGVAEAIERFIL